MIANKKAPKVSDKDIDRIISKIYDDLNNIIKAVNNYEGTFEEWKGKRGDIRITEKGLQYRDRFGWKTVAVSTHTHSYADDDHTHD